MKSIWHEAAQAAIVGLVLLTILLTLFGPKLQSLETRLWWLQLTQQEVTG
jgi:hypothetical protein